MSSSVRLVRGLAYPAYEWLRGRNTLGELERLRLLMQLRPQALQVECTRRLQALLAFAHRCLPYYAEVFRRYGVDPRSDGAFAELRKLPVLTKGEIRANADRLRWADVPGGLIPHSSGGTTGDTLHFFIDRLRQSQTMASRLYMQGLFGVGVGERRVYLWGSPIEARGGRLRRWRDRMLNELLIDAFEMSPAGIDRHLATIAAFDPAVLYGYPSAVALLARRRLERGRSRTAGSLRLIVLTGEEISDEQRACVRAAFEVPVVSEYGSREVGLIAHECPSGTLHALSPFVHVEAAQHGLEVARGQTGSILCTTLTTRAQPMIRYAVGDAGRMLASDCPCGLPLPPMQLDGGKITGFIALPDGRLCHGAVTSHMLRDEPGIVEYKTIQRAALRFEIILVVDDEFDRGTIERVRRRYARLCGPGVRVDCRLVERIPPDPSGKRRYVVSEVAPQVAQSGGIRLEGIDDWLSGQGAGTGAAARPEKEAAVQAIHHCGRP